MRAFACGEDRILVADEPAVLEQHAIAVDEQRERLPHPSGRVDERDVVNVDVVAGDSRGVRRERVDRSLAGMVIPLDDGSVHAFSDDRDPGLPCWDQQLLTIDAIFHEDCARNRRVVADSVDGFLNRPEVAAAVLRDDEVERIGEGATRRRPRRARSAVTRASGVDRVGDREERIPDETRN